MSWVTSICYTERIKHKVNLYKEDHSVCLLVGIGTLPPPLSPASVTLPPEPKGRAHSPASEGLGESQFQSLKQKLSTPPTLWNKDKEREKGGGQ